MRYPSEWSQMHVTLAHDLPLLRPAQCRGLALWVCGTILAQSSCQNAVMTALLARGAWHGLRQRLRERLYDGPDKAAPCQAQLDVTWCFELLLRWVLTWWQLPRICEMRCRSRFSHNKTRRPSPSHRKNAGCWPRRTPRSPNRRPDSNPDRFPRCGYPCRRRERRDSARRQAAR
jgi:hypothetical protein